jgi:hypothetical protein
MSEPPPSRLSAVDVVRGAAIGLMAFEHTRDYTTNLRFPPWKVPDTPFCLCCVLEVEGRAMPRPGRVHVEGGIAHVHDRLV